MKKYFIPILAALTLLPSCKKPAGDSFSPFGKQWLINHSDWSEIVDFTVEPGFYFSVSDSWKDLPAGATYVVDEYGIHPYTYTVKDGVYHLDVPVYGDGTDQVRYYEEYSDITAKTAKFKSFYHDSTQDIVDEGTATVVENPVKLARTPLVYCSLKRSFAWYTIRPTANALVQFKQMAKTKSVWGLIVLGKEGADSDYADMDVNGKIVAVKHAFFGTGAGTGLTPAQKREIAAAKGAAALILLYENPGNSPFNLDQINTIPTDAAGIPVAIFPATGTSFQTANYEIVPEG